MNVDKSKSILDISFPMKMNKDVDSALHVLKGAVQDVLGATLTTSVFADGLKGRLTVEMEYRPADDDMERVEESANDKIGAAREVSGKAGSSISIWVTARGKRLGP